MRRLASILVLNAIILLSGVLLSGCGKVSPAKNNLHIPPLLDTRSTSELTLTMRNGEHEFYPGVKSETMGFNGDYLGPTIRLYKNVSSKITFFNNLKESTTVHGHGLHVPGAIDGGPQAIIKPGDRWKIEIPVHQQAGTSWYHPHLMGKTAEHVYGGLAGVYLIEDENSLRLNLPKKYGVNDILLIVQDRSFSNGKMQPYTVSPEIMMEGVRGDTLVVNGTVDAYQLVPKSWVRLRLVNGANAQFYRFYFKNKAPFYKIATEGGFLNKPIKLTQLDIAPGERNEIMIDLSNGKNTALMAQFLPAEGEDEAFFMSWFAPKKRVLELRVDESIEGAGILPEKLNEIAYFKREDAKKTRTFTLEMDENGEATVLTNMFRINGRSMDMNFINERLLRGEVEIWRITAEEMPHPFHVHGVSFQILTHLGQPPSAADNGWKDTVVVEEEVTELIMRFDYRANEKYPYMYHCHILEHEDGGMMGQFTVK